MVLVDPDMRLDWFLSITAVVLLPLAGAPGCCYDLVACIQRLLIAGIRCAVVALTSGTCVPERQYHNMSRHHYKMCYKNVCYHLSILLPLDRDTTFCPRRNGG